MSDGSDDGRRSGDAARSVAGTVAGMVVAAGAAVFIAVTGAASPADAVIGGSDATEDYPFMVSLHDAKGAHYCGGALIDRQWVVTAGHCTVYDAADITARIGSHDKDAGGAERGIAEIATHPDYTGDPENMRHDIALLRLDEPVEERPIGIAAESGAPGTAVRTMGWGMTCENGSNCPDLPATLQELDTEIVADDRCAKIDGASDICSEHPTEEAQTCSADSGGPMIQRTRGTWELIGVTSRDGDGGADPHCVGPGVWTDTTAYADWIANTIGADNRV